jgi:hypothetical protein
MDCIDVAQGRDQWKALVRTVMNLRLPYNTGKFLSSCTICGFSRRAQMHDWMNVNHTAWWSVRLAFVTLFCKQLRLLCGHINGIWDNIIFCITCERWEKKDILNSFYITNSLKTFTSHCVRCSQFMRLFSFSGIESLQTIKYPGNWERMTSVRYFLCSIYFRFSKNIQVSFPGKLQT